MLHDGLPRLFSGRLAVTGFVGVAALVLASCDSAPFVAPSGSAITLVASPGSVPTNGASDITAIVVEGAQGVSEDSTSGTVVPGTGTLVHNGTEVFFTTTLGRIEPADAKTTGGRATARLFGDGRSGTAVVRATSGGATSTIEIDIGAATATRIALTATPQALPTGGGTSLVTARVEDQQGNPVQDVLVSFTTTRGSLTPSSDLSNQQGIARTTLSTTAEAVVTATSGGSASSLSGSVTVTVAAAAGS